MGSGWNDEREIVEGCATLQNMSKNEPREI